MEPADLADLLRTAFVSLPAVVSVTPRVVDDGVELDVEFRDADGRFEQSISSRLDLASAEPGRLAAYARAVAARAQELGAGDSEALWALLTPSSILLQSVLDDRSLQTEADFLALLQDPDRLDRAARREQVRRMVPGRQDLDDRLAAALYALCWEGRTGAAWTETTAALRTLCASGDDSLLVACMRAWIDEYDPDETAWPNGPSVSNLLILAAWKHLDARLSGPVRREALDVVDRIADATRPSPAAMARAGF
jgi:hypothetical protein